METSRFRKYFYYKIDSNYIKRTKKGWRYLQPFLYPGRDLNPYEHYCSLDFKSNVSTNSTIWAGSKNPSKKERSLSEWWDSDPRPSPWQGDALPLSYTRKWVANLIKYSFLQSSETLLFLSDMFFNFIKFQ